MKNFYKAIGISRRGAGILLSMSFLGIGITTTVVTYSSQAVRFHRSILTAVNGYRSLELARAGLEAGLLSAQGISEEYLFTLGIIASPPRILITQDCNERGNCTKYYVSYSIQPEDGKLNLNHLVRNDDEPNQNFRNIVSRLFESLNLDVDSIGAIIDWIDKNNSESIGGAEASYYQNLPQARKIKNSYLYSLSELTVIKGFDYDKVFSPRIPPEFARNQKELASRTETEEILIQDDDWVLANNVTACLPRQLLGSEKISVNAARYHVLLSLTASLGRPEVLAIFKLRSERDGYIKNKQDIEGIAELQRPGILGVSLAKELLGTGQTSGTLKTQSRFYRVTGIGYITVGTDTEERSLAVRRVWGIWDKTDKKFLYYSED